MLAPRLLRGARPSACPMPSASVSATALRFVQPSILSITTRRTLRIPPGQSSSSSSSISRQSNPSSPSPANHDGASNPADADAASTSSSSPSPPTTMATLLAQTSDEYNSLLAPVHIPEDPKAVLKSDHPARQILAESGIVVQRQIEMMNVFLGFEQANRYIILDPHGQQIGYLAEHDGGFGKAMGRQWFRTHRAFTTHIFDRHGHEVLRFHRPFSWINSTIRVLDPHDPAGSSQPCQGLEQMQYVSPLPLDAMRIIGEAHSEWAPLRRKYNLFLAHHAQHTNIIDNPASSVVEMAQFARIDEPFLSWDFSLLDADKRLIGSVNRTFRGFAREIFTDTGAYVLRMDSAGLDQEADKSHIISHTNQTTPAYAEAVGGVHDTKGMTLDQRAVMLATAVTVDFDYFSRHSRSSAGLFPIWVSGGGEAVGGAAAGAAGGAAAGGVAEAGAASTGIVLGGAGRAMGGAAAGASEVGVAEGAMAGAGSIAGYEAMRQGMGRSPAGDNMTSPQTPEQPYGAQQPFDDPYMPQSGAEGDSQEVWGGDNDPWKAGQGEGSGGEGDGGLTRSLWESFFGD